MSLRFFTLLYRAIERLAKKRAVFMLLVILCPYNSESQVANDDLKKQAGKLFEEEEYSGAYKLYSQLVSNFPKDPVYNYRLGVCMIYSEPDKKKCLPYLKFAVTNADNKELKDVKFYLGKAFHINYRFDDAIKNYNDYKLTASSSQLKKLQVDREIRACANGKHLLSNLTDLEIISKSELSENDYFRNYKNVGGKLLVKPDEFKTSTDKKKKEKSVVFLPTGSNVVYFSSYGDNTDNGKDLYTSARLQNGTYSKPEKVKGINTEYDEDYPFLHPNGKTLYFASKGHNSMGGYDIFKSFFNEETNTWSAPVNLEFPINSPDDDFLFVTDSLETLAYFSTGRQSVPGKIDVLKTKTKRKPIDVIAMKGNVIMGNPEHSLKSTINIKDILTQNDLGSYSAEEDGSYAMELPNGGKLLFTVETPGLETQSAPVSLPIASAAKPFKQTISYEKGKLKILNYFEESANDDTYLQYLNVIEKKAKLDVNESASETQPLAVNTTNPEVGTGNKEKTENKEGIVDNNSSNTIPSNPLPDPKGSMNNKQLAGLAKQESVELKQEAAQLKRDFIAANETADNQKREADKKLTEANDAIAKAETISDETEKKVAIEAASALKQEAEVELVGAAKTMEFAKTLETDAINKEKEATLNSEYAAELEKASKNKNNKSSIAKLEELQKQIDELSGKKKESEGIITDYKTSIEEKEKQISNTEQTINNIKTNLEEVKTAIADKETELANTRKKSAKKEISSEIEGLKTEQEDKLQQISAKEAELKTLTNELAVSKNQLELAEKITSENIAANTTTNLNNTNEKISISSIQSKYKDKTTVLDLESRSSIEESTVQLNKFNKELDQLISKNKTELNKTKNKEIKQRLSDEIKLSEAVKKQNQLQIADNNKRLSDLNVTAEQNSETAKTIFNPITASTTSEAVTKLDNLTTQLDVNDAQNFDYNGYQNPQAQNLKIEADAKINDAIARQKKLKDEITTSKQDIQKSGSGITTQQLNKEAETLISQSQKLREDAKTKKGEAKTKLIEDAKNLEEQANIKYIEAAEITRSDNAYIISTNQGNIQDLITENKSSEADLNLVNSLKEEARLAYKKAADIRVEGNSLSNAGGKLGSFSNAEEKEAEAILKQQQAIDILIKSNPGFTLKTPITSTSTSNNSGGVDIAGKLQTVNANLADLAAIKVESYQKLYEANEAEINQLIADIKDNQSVIDKTPSLKTDFISGNNKLESARNNKQKADNAAGPDEKLSQLNAGIKKQNEAIKQFNAIKNSIAQVNTSQNEVVNNKVETPENSILEENPLFNENVNTPVTKEKVMTPENELGLLSEIDTQEINVSELAKKDTTTDQIIAYFDNNNLYMRNPNAGSTAKSALNQLKDYEAQNSDLNEALNKVTDDPSELVNPKVLNAKADTLMGEAEELNEDSQDFKKEAQGKEGEEKNYTLAQARELEIKAQDKMILAADYRQKANENEYKTNTNSINELINKLKTDNPTMASEMEAKRDELDPLKIQINNLRAEANALGNKAAKIGAYSNAEEKEIEFIQKQNDLLTQLKKQYPDYVPAPLVVKSPQEQTSELLQKKSSLREKQYSELTNLTNAFSLEYESYKNNVPANLTEEQQLVKKNADELNSESKRLLIQASQEKDENEKIKLLTLAAKSGNTAVEKLNKLLPKSGLPQNGGLDELARIGNEIVSTNNEDSENTTAAGNTKTKKGTIKINGLEVVQGNAYSNANPIPIDAQMGDGLVFRVQIGAFKNRLPNNAFKGLSPLNGETTNSGYIRYTAGNFDKIESANAVKNDLRNLGYSDAFVVVYLNGKRITLAEALAEMNRQGKTVDPTAPQTAGITANINVPRAAVNTAVQESVTVTKELEQIDGLLYTIQIGVYAKQVTKPQLLGLRPIFREQLTNGLYRYTAGIYNNPERLLLDKNKVVDLGVKDAFVSAYLNGKRIPFAEAKERQTNEAATIKLEAENPIIFPDRNTPVPNPFDVLLSTNVNVEPFKNDVKEYPAPTPENGVKKTEDGVCFKVQIGAFSKEVPADVAAKFSSIRTWPVDNKQINGLFIYNIGNFSEAKFAKSLKEEAVRLGLTDAFITVYKDGRKLYGFEAEGYIR